MTLSQDASVAGHCGMILLPEYQFNKASASLKLDIINHQE